MDLQIPNPGFRPGGGKHRRISLVHGPLDQGTGDHGAEAVHREDPVHRQTERHSQIFLPGIQHQRVEGLLQFRDALPGIGRDGENGLSLQECPLHPLGDFLPHHIQPFGVHHVGLGHGHKAVLDAQKRQNAQMLHGLGHEALIRGHHQHGKVNPPRPRQHIFNKFLMARHIYDARLRPVFKVQMGKAQLDGDAPLFLLLKPVGVDPGEGLDQQGFPVVHVARGADDHMLHRRLSLSASTMQENSSSRSVRASSR
ncbi:hypothetical protein SDC9_91915 [bioreactor metagenome]|uniref:Uncharacterized protein n=1 Tax=bioreactor metagenome TaxID=1076179 RepID=A0A644ZW73_9ZZZZ